LRNNELLLKIVLDLYELNMAITYGFYKLVAS